MVHNFIDMTGWIMSEHGVEDSQLTVLEYAGDQKWLCSCSCGNQKVIKGQHIRNGNTKSCGCLATKKIQERNRNQGHIIQIGERFGKLTVIADLGLRKQKSRDKQWRWSLCQCDCGSAPIEVANNSLISGHKISCGCEHSYGEFEIKQLLDANCIKYKTEYSFSDLKNPKTNQFLHFDFAIFKEDNISIDYLIEFDGRQHRNGPEAKWSGRDTLEDIQFRDDLKNNYCKNNNYILKRIPSTDLHKFTYQDIISNKYDI